MTRREITRIASTVDEGRPNSRRKRLHDDAPSIPSIAGGASRQREQHVLAVRQDLRAVRFLAVLDTHERLRRTSIG